MKKTFLFFFVLSICLGSLYGQTTPPKGRPLLVASKGIRNDFTYWDGTSLKTVPNFSIPLASQLQGVRDYMQNNREPNANPAWNSNGDVYVVAQSMGGLRALGYAAADPQRVKAVVTIGSPVMGFSPLRQGQEKLSEKAGVIASTIVVGYGEVVKYKNPATKGLAVPVVLVAALSLDYVKQRYWLSERDIVGLALNHFSVDDPLVWAIQKGGTIPVVKDLAPQSDFINNNIAFTHPGYWRETYDKWKLVFYWQWDNWYSGHFVCYWTPDYYNVWVEPSVEAKIPASTYLYQIVGTDADPINLLPPEKKAEVRASISALSADLKEASDYYDAMSRAWIWPAKTFYEIERDACNRAQAYMANPGKAIAEVLDTTESDGAIPKADQFHLGIGGRPAFTNGATRKENQVFEWQLTHTTELDDPKIWGNGNGNQGLASGQGVYDDGKIHDFLLATMSNDTTRYDELKNGKGYVQNFHSF